MKIIEYLERNFPDKDVVKEKVSLDLGINVDQAGDLFLFKYHMLDVKWQREECHECRGLILERTPNEWKIVSRPFDKFFNYGEHYCSLDEEHFKENPNRYYLSEKADGTCIQAYFYNGEWRISTLGKIITTFVNNVETFTFEDLWWNTIKDITGKDKDQFCEDYMRKGATYIFELCTPHNRVVSRYPEKFRIYLLGIRNVEPYDDVTKDCVHSPIVFDCAQNMGVQYPIMIPCKKVNGDLSQFCEDQKGRMDCEYPEGFVLYRTSYPVAKIKLSSYLVLHRIIGGDPELTQKSLVRCFFTGNIDDIRPALDDKWEEQVSRLENYIRLDVQGVRKIGMNIHFEMPKKATSDGAKRKAYALLVQKYIPKIFQGYFYQNMDEVLSGSTVGFSDWLCRMHEKHMDFWRGIMGGRNER